MSQTHDLLCIWLLPIFICLLYAQMSSAQSAWFQLLMGVVKRWLQHYVFCRDIQLLPYIWEGGCQNPARRRVPKPCNKLGATSSLIIAQATRRSKAEQTVAQLLPPLPAGKTLSTGIVPGQGGVGSCRVRESSFPQQGLQESTMLPNSMASALGGSHTVSQVAPIQVLSHWVCGGCGGALLPAAPRKGSVASEHCDSLITHPGPASSSPWGGWVAPSGPDLGTVLLSHAEMWHTCMLDWREHWGPTRLIIIPPVGGTFPQILTFCFFHMLWFLSISRVVLELRSDS